MQYVDHQAKPVSCTVRFADNQQQSSVKAMYLKRKQDPYTDRDAYGGQRKAVNVQAPPPTDDDAFYGPNSGRGRRDNADSATPPPGKGNYTFSQLYR